MGQLQPRYWRVRESADPRDGSTATVPGVVSRAEVKDHLAGLLHEIAAIPLDQISESATIDEELQMQSVAFVELQVAVEEAYDVELDPLQVIALNAFGAIVDYVHELAVQRAT